MRVTGATHGVRELLEAAFATAGLDWQNYGEVDAKCIRPAEVDYLCGDARKAKRKLCWPTVRFEELIK